jgi:hypothetical protein
MKQVDIHCLRDHGPTMFRFCGLAFLTGLCLGIILVIEIGR